MKKLPKRGGYKGHEHRNLHIKPAQILDRMLNSCVQGRFQGTLKIKMGHKIGERTFQLPCAKEKQSLELANYGNCLLEQNSTPALANFAQ